MYFQCFEKHLRQPEKLRELGSARSGRRLGWQVARALEASSSETLPPLPDEPLYTTVSCSHTNLFLRCLQAKTCRTHNSKLQDPVGNIDSQRIFREQPDLMEAAFKGLTWRVIKEEASKVWPTLAAYAQRALNFEARQVVSETECIGGAWL